MTAVVQQSPLPSRHAVRSVIEGLVGRDVDIADGVPVPSKTTNVVAAYVGDKLALQAVCIVDIEAAARLGGALAMVPKGGVDDAISERDLPPTLRDNCYEVLNVLASVFNVPNAPHVRLYEMYGPNQGVPGDVAAVAGLAGSRMDIALKIAGYGDGMMSIVVK
jgi:hypothetical protein